MAKKQDLKTQKTKVSVTAYINAIENENIRKDAKEALKIMKEVSKMKPAMWGTSIIGFGDYKYKRANGKEFNFFRAGFAPRKDRITFYIMPGYADMGDLLEKLGPYTKGKACLHIKRLSDIHIPTLKKIIKAGLKDMEKRYPSK